jgi:hypothetical protein
MMFAAGLSWKYIFAAFAAAGAAVAVAFAFFSDKIGKGYQWYRILAVLDPENTTGWAPSETVWKNIIYQQQRGEIALGSASFDFGQYAGSGDRTAGDACLAERLGDEAGALRFAERKLRVAVQVAAKLYGCHG